MNICLAITNEKPTDGHNYITKEKLSNTARMTGEENCKISNAAAACGVNRITLAMYFSKGRKGYHITSSMHITFTDTDEKSLADHIKMLDSLFHGLSQWFPTRPPRGPLLILGGHSHHLTYVNEKIITNLDSCLPFRLIYVINLIGQKN